jgi:hypothetical protein
MFYFCDKIMETSKGKCPICIADDVELKSLSCKHEVCEPCMTTWHEKCYVLGAHTSCPICRNIENEYTGPPLGPRNLPPHTFVPHTIVSIGIESTDSGMRTEECRCTRLLCAYIFGYCIGLIFTATLAFTIFTIAQQRPS